MKIRRTLLVIGLILVSIDGQAKGRRSKCTGLLINSTIVYDLESGEKRFIARPDKGWIFSEGYLSPDGKKILFNAKMKDENGRPLAEEIRTINLDGTGTRVWYRARNIWNFAWSPDSRFIFVGVSTLEDADMIIDTVSETAWLTKVPKGFTSPVDPVWSRDGRSLFYARPDGSGEDTGYTIMRVNLNGDNAQAVVSLPKEGGASLSPDEQSVAYVPVFDRDLYLVHVKTGKLKSMGATAAEESFQFWSPDGKWIGVMEGTASMRPPMKFVAVNAETGEREPLLREYGFQLSWWQPPARPLPDCHKAVREQLGPGRPLADVLRQIEDLSPAP
jgi:Tol biopolymer transport system component